MKITLNAYIIIKTSLFSGILFWITTLYVIFMVLSAYFAMSFLFDLPVDEIPPIKILFSYGFFLVIFTLYYINGVSQEVADNLSNLKECVAGSSLITFEEKWQLVEKMNSFNGFDAWGYYKLGRPLLTSIVANFTTFIIVLIQFKMSETTSSTSNEEPEINM